MIENVFPYKRCHWCEGWKTHDCFPCGYNRCRDCRDAYSAQWREENREKINENSRKYQMTVRGRALSLLGAARTRARKKNEVFLLSHDDVELGIRSGFCSKTFLPYDLTILKRGLKTTEYKINPLSPSIDKIKPEGIYEPNNVQYVCSWYNLAKGQMSEEDLISFCKRVASLNP